MSATRDLIYALVFFFAGFSLCVLIVRGKGDSYKKSLSIETVLSAIQFVCAVALIILQLVALKGS